MSDKIERLLDATGWEILRALQENARVSWSVLGRRVGLSAPAVAERVRRMEDAGLITGYRAQVDPARAGQPLSAFVQMRCTTGRCLLKTTRAEDFPEVLEIHKLSGNACSMLRVRVASMRHLEGLFERLGEHGEMNTHVVLSTEFEGRPVQPPVQESRPVTRSEGWGGRS